MQTWNHLFVLALFCAIADLHLCSTVERPTPVNRDQLVPVGHQRTRSDPALTADWFLCKRGNVITACRRHQQSLPQSAPTAPPIKTAKPRSAAAPKKCSAKKCIHGRCVGRRCVCDAGWRGKYCAQDINECSKKLQLNTCSQRCKNTIGSFRCTCYKGYELQVDGQTCRTRRVLTSSRHNATALASQMPAGLRSRTMRRPRSRLQLPSVSHRYAFSPFLNAMRLRRRRRPVAPARGAKHVRNGNAAALTALRRQVEITTTAATIATKRYLSTLGYLSAQAKPTPSVPWRNACVLARCQYKCELVTPTRAACICPNGYRLARNRRKCIDINECKLNTHQCGASRDCHNTHGGYKCKCRKGYTLAFNLTHKFCQDINECLTGEHKCGMNSDCVNSHGSYSCRCKAGFTRTGSSCRDNAFDVEADTEERLAASNSTIVRPARPNNMRKVVSQPAPLVSRLRSRDRAVPFYSSKYPSARTNSLRRGSPQWRRYRQLAMKRRMLLKHRRHTSSSSTNEKAPRS